MITKDKNSIANLKESDKQYQKAMFFGSRNLLIALWRHHPYQLEYAKACGRQVVKP